MKDYDGISILRSKLLIWVKYMFMIENFLNNIKDTIKDIKYIYLQNG